MDILRVDKQDVKNFLIGPTKSGKSTLCHALYGSKMTISTMMTVQCLILNYLSKLKVR